jgi:hypothetical protein
MNQAGVFIRGAGSHQTHEEIYPDIFPNMGEQPPDLDSHLTEGFAGRHRINQLVKSFVAHHSISEI